MSEAPPGAPPSPPRAAREQPRRPDKGAQCSEASMEGTATASLGAAQRLRAQRSSSYSPPPAGPLSVWDVMKLLGGAIRVLVLSADEDAVDDGCSILWRPVSGIAKENLAQASYFVVTFGQRAQRVRRRK